MKNLLRLPSALRLGLVLAAPLALLLTAAPAFAANKDMIQLQTQIQQLQDAVARLQQSNDERMGVLKDLVQQSADSVNRMSVAVDTLQKQMAAQQAAEGAKVDTVSGQVQALNDSLDELKARMGRLEKVMQDVQSQQQSISASLQNNAPAGGGMVPAAGPATAAPVQSAPSDGSAMPPAGGMALAGPPPAPAAPPVDSLYKAAINDYMAAKYTIATPEFADVIKAYPDDALAGNSWYYLAEIDYRAGKYAIAARDYDKVIEQFPDNNKVPAAHLHKGQALLQLKQTEAGVRELRALIQRFPNSPEAMQARSRLNGMGIPIRPRTAAPLVP
jgi:tol-pal system protein YbgF